MPPLFVYVYLFVYIKLFSSVATGWRPRILPRVKKADGPHKELKSAREADKNVA